MLLITPQKSDNHSHSQTLIYVSANKPSNDKQLGEVEEVQDLDEAKKNEKPSRLVSPERKDIRERRTVIIRGTESFDVERQRPFSV